jgi:chromosome segregation ATPase
MRKSKQHLATEQIRLFVYALKTRGSLLIFLSFSALLALRSPLCFAEESTTPEMRAEYDKISALKMNKYDELRAEISLLRDRIEALQAVEPELLAEKVKAESDLDGYADAEKILQGKIEKARAAASGEEAAMKRAADKAAEESVARRQKIDKLTADLKNAMEKKERLQRSKDRLEAEVAARDSEYKDLSKKMLALKEKNLAGDKDAAAAGSGDLKKRMSEIELKAQAGASQRQQLSEEVLAIAEEIRKREENISALENEDFAQLNALRSKIENPDGAPAEDRGAEREIGALKKKTEEVAAKIQKGKARVKEVQAELERVTEERLQAEKDLAQRTDEFKVRVSALIAQSDRVEALLPEGLDRGEKALRHQLKRTEKDLTSLQRKAERTSMENDELEIKYNKGMLDKHFNLAVVYETNGRYQDAEREYLECLKIDPKDADVHYNLAILYDDRLNSTAKALEHYKKFLAHRPIEEFRRYVRDYILRAELEKRFGSKVR